MWMADKPLVQVLETGEYDGNFMNISLLSQGRTNPRRQVAMAPGRFMVAHCIFDSNYFRIMYVFAVFNCMGPGFLDWLLDLKELSTPALSQGPYKIIFY
jgi:hypothetical protein